MVKDNETPKPSGMSKVASTAYWNGRSDGRFGKPNNPGDWGGGVFNYDYFYTTGHGHGKRDRELNPADYGA